MLEEVVKFKKEVHIIIVIIAVFAIVCFWRGVWGILDLFLFPENLLLSFCVSVAVGLVILLLIRNRI